MFRSSALALVLLAAPARAEDSVAVLKAQVDVKQGHVKFAEATLAAAKQSLQRLEILATKGIVAREELDKAKTDVELAAAQLVVKQAEVREAEAKLKDREGDAKALGAKVAVFNMAAIMRDFDKAKYKMHVLNLRKDELSAPLAKLQEEAIATQKDFSEESDPKKREKLEAAVQDLQRKYHAAEASISKRLNDDASTIISELHDDVVSVVKEIAEARGFSLVLAYPAAVSDEEKNNPYLKELKLKPPAAQPFFVAKELDITAAIIKKLNADRPAVDKDGKKVDVSKLPPVVTPMMPPMPGKKP